MCLVSLHWILSIKYTSCDNIDEVDEVESEYRHSRCDLASCDNRECRNEECEHDRPRVTHDEFARDIRSSQIVGDRYDDREYREEKSTILLTCQSCICEIEFEC